MTVTVIVSPLVTFLNPSASPLAAALVVIENRSGVPGSEIGVNSTVLVAPEVKTETKPVRSTGVVGIARPLKNSLETEYEVGQ